MFVSRVVFKGPQGFVTKPENDFDITQASLSTRNRPFKYIGGYWEPPELITQKKKACLYKNLHREFKLLLPSPI
jgi:hypothetical protein